MDNLASKMTGYFNNEDDQRDAAIPCLNYIFLAHRGINIPKLAATAIGSVRTDGHNTVTHGIGTMAIEFKNWSTGITSFPLIELVCYIVHLDAKGMDDVIHQPPYLQWRPRLNPTIVGELDVSTFHIYSMF